MEQGYGEHRFNPYFTGCFSFRIPQSPGAESMMRCFNPYFTGCFSFSAGYLDTATGVSLFQSLFYWMLFF